MREYIEREEVMKTARDGYHSDFGRSMADLTSLEEVLEDTPIADVEEIRHGKWIMRGGIFRCSECDSKALTRDVGGTGGFSHEFEQVKSKRCPECGAKMDKKDGE